MGQVLPGARFPAANGRPDYDSELARAGAVIVDHGLQVGSGDAAAEASRQAKSFGLDPVVITRVTVGTEGGPEAAARTLAETANSVE